MRKYLRFILPALLVATTHGFAISQPTDHELVQTIKREIARNLDVLSKEPVAVSYISVRLERVYGTQVLSSFGNTQAINRPDATAMSVYLRVGDDKVENLDATILNQLDQLWNEDTMEVKKEVWRSISQLYNMVLEKAISNKSRQAVLVAAPDKAPYFSSPELPSNFITANVNPLKALLAPKLLEDKANKYSAEFLKNPDISHTETSYSSVLIAKYFIDSQGAGVVQNIVNTNLMIVAEAVASDGMVMPLFTTYQFSEPADLPSDAVVMADVKKISANLSALKVAPLAEPYSGVALLSPKATGVFFHEFFGHRIEGARLKSQTDAGTFKNSVGQEIFSKEISVVYDPTVDKFENQPLFGSYIYDDQGVKGQRVEVVKDGRLTNFLMSRTPIDGFANSNGHGRGAISATCEARQSNMFITSSNAKSEAELRKMLISQIKEQGTEFGYYIDQVSGGYTSTMVYMPNVFNISPLLIYRVWADGRKDELVRGVSLIGTPLAVFAQIIALGNRYEVFNGMCSAISGQIPVSAIAPSMLIRNLETQRSTTPQMKPVILPRPDQTK